MGELTDRYVGATLRSIPEKQRADIEAELRASIGDEIDARIGDLIILALIVLAVTWDIVDGFRKARKAR